MRLNMNIVAEVEECGNELLGSVGDSVADKEVINLCHENYTILVQYNKHVDLRLCDR